MPKSVLESFKPRDHAEAVALFRAEIVGALARRELTHGELHAELVALAARRYRPPGSLSTRKYGASTLERWYYAYQRGGLAALQPDPRSDRGPCRSLPEALRQLLCDIRREHPGASVPLILRTLVDDGRMVEGAVDETTVRRLFRTQGLDRVTLRNSASPKTRLRWLRMRMARAGCEREVFSSDAITMIHEAAAGAMRETDRLAQAALRETARRKKKLVERDSVQRLLAAAA